MPDQVHDQSEAEEHDRLHQQRRQAACDRWVNAAVTVTAAAAVAVLTGTGLAATAARRAHQRLRRLNPRRGRR